MNQVKRYLGFIWMLTGPVSFLFLVLSAVKNINASGQGDISNPIPWVIIISIFAPIAIGLSIFGWYCWKGEYDDLQE